MLGAPGEPWVSLSRQTRPSLHPCADPGGCSEPGLLSGPSFGPGSELVEREQSWPQTTCRPPDRQRKALCASQTRTRGLRRRLWLAGQEHGARTDPTASSQNGHLPAPQDTKDEKGWQRAGGHSPCPRRRAACRHPQFLHQPADWQGGPRAAWPWRPGRGRAPRQGPTGAQCPLGRRCSVPGPSGTLEGEGWQFNLREFPDQYPWEHGAFQQALRPWLLPYVPACGQ